MIFNIQRFSIHDGPGIRTTVFLKGCPLCCIWCHNPEGIKPESEVMYYRERCIGCGNCVRSCPEGVHTVDKEGKATIDRNLCKGACIESCYAEALVRVGKEISAQEVVDEAKRDEAFYRNSGGGITLSGGEPLFQPEFTFEVLKRCKQLGLHTCLDTCGYASWEILNDILPYVDLFLYDLKILNSKLHKEHTGVENELILENLKKIITEKKEIEVRMPLIPGYNNSEGNLHDTAAFLNDRKIEKIVLLPYSQLGLSKYRALGKKYRLENLQPVGDEEVEQAQRILEACGISVGVQ